MFEQHWPTITRVAFAIFAAANILNILMDWKSLVLWFIIIVAAVLVIIGNRKKNDVSVP